MVMLSVHCILCRKYEINLRKMFYILELKLFESYILYNTYVQVASHNPYIIYIHNIQSWAVYRVNFIGRECKNLNKLFFIFTADFSNNFEFFSFKFFRGPCPSPNFFNGCPCLQQIVYLGRCLAVITHNKINI